MRPSSRLSALPSLVLFTMIAGLAGLAAPAPAQLIFVEQQSTRFPQPAATDYTNQLTFADIDGDGDLDILWGNGSTSNYLERIYINDGTAHFTDESAARGAISCMARGVEVADVDNDGDLDVAYANDNNTLPRLLINDGTGHFTDQTTTRLPNITLASSRVEFADVDNDGDLDMYLVNGGATRFGTARGKLYLNDGTGHFTDVTNTNTPNQTVSQPMDCLFGDVDADYDLDLRIGSRGGQSKLYRNNGAGVFTDISSGVPVDGTTYSYDFGDIDGDGDIDLLGVNSLPGSSAELLLANNGTGVYTNVSSQLVPNPSIDDNDSRFFDYDNDGDMDLIVASLGSTERIYKNNGLGTFNQVSGIITAVADSSLDVKVGDLDNDGRLDIVTGQGESGSFINRIYMNVTGPVDTLPPTIVRTENPPNIIGGNYVVRATVTDGMTSDRNFFYKAMELHFTYNGGADHFVTMRWSGGMVYRGVIPANLCGGNLTYFVRSTDAAGNTGNGATQTYVIPPGTPPTGDLNGDAVVDDADLVIFVNVLTGADTDPTHVSQSDMNCDAIPDGLDIGPFTDVLIP